MLGPRIKVLVKRSFYKGIHGYTDFKAGGPHYTGLLGFLLILGFQLSLITNQILVRILRRLGCGFGDSCKFMHDRGDYKSGWQMEREWDEAEKVKRNLVMGLDVVEEEGGVGGADHDSYEDNELPFACSICQSFDDPIVTKCKHYFCEHCALKRNSKNKKCFVCNEPTLGIFNSVHEIKKKMAAEGK